MGLFSLFRKRENLIIKVDILTKRKYDHDWQKQHIGDLLVSFSKDFFNESCVLWFREKDLFSSFEIVLEGSKFKLNKIEDINDLDQFVHKYSNFLPFFLPIMIGILRSSGLDFKISKIHRLESSLDDYVKSLVLQKAEEVDENKGGKIDPLNIWTSKKKI
ncbi:MAG: hypothetical protein NTX24_02310 [Candidatus Pacearchaeota archaeon]|nr:hypothetical protein [Candidatus Pacearchaeota archaeon]